MKSKKTKFGVFPVIVAVFAAYYLTDVWGGRFETVGYGLLCASFVYILTMVLAVKGLAGSRAGRLAAMVDWGSSLTDLLRAHGFALLFFLSLVFYAYLQTVLGFTAATALGFMWLLWFMRVRSIGRWLALSGALTALSHVILVELLDVPLSEGPFSG